MHATPYLRPFCLLFVAVLVFLWPLDRPLKAHAREILLVHDKGLPLHYLNSRRDLREQRFDRNSYLYVIDLDSREILRKYPTRYGVNEGNKAREGDLRTPVGKYEILQSRKKDCDSFFGPRSVLINYPNRFDRQRRNPGCAITIHGGPQRRTAGCIRLLDHRHLIIPYECPQTRWNREQHVKAIWELHDKRYDRRGIPLLSFSSLHRSYGGREGETLSHQAIDHYRDLLDRENLSNMEIDRMGAKKNTEPTNRPIPGRVTIAHASSCLGNFHNIKYKAENVLDGKSSTAWVEGSSGPGFEEYIGIILPEEQAINEISIINGYNKRTKSGDRWLQNNRVKKFRIEIPGIDKGILMPLEDTRDWQTYSLREPVRTRYVKLIIEDVYYGTKWKNDTCISEIRIR